MLDWQRESANMAAIFQNCYLSTAAARSADGNGGCFSIRPSYPQSRELAFKNTNAYVRRPIGHDGDIKGLTGDVNGLILGLSFQSQLHHRAWTFQERILAFRTVHYFEDELVWECAGRDTCERGAYNEYPARYHDKRRLRS